MLSSFQFKEHELIFPFKKKKILAQRLAIAGKL